MLSGVASAGAALAALKVTRMVSPTLSSPGCASASSGSSATAPSGKASSEGPAGSVPKLPVAWTTVAALQTSEVEGLASAGSARRIGAPLAHATLYSSPESGVAVSGGSFSVTSNVRLSSHAPPKLVPRLVPSGVVMVKSELTVVPLAAVSTAASNTTRTTSPTASSADGLAETDVTLWMRGRPLPQSELACGDWAAGAHAAEGSLVRYTASCWQLTVNPKLESDASAAFEASVTVTSSWSAMTNGAQVPT